MHLSARFQIKQFRLKVEIDWTIKRREQLYDDDDNDDSIKSAWVVVHNIDSACTQLQATAHDFPLIIFKHNARAIKLLLNSKCLFSNSHHKSVTLSFYVNSVIRRAFRIFFSLFTTQCCWTYFCLTYFQRERRLEPVYMLFAFVPLIWIQLHLPALQMLSSTSSLISWSNFSAL